MQFLSDEGVLNLKTEHCHRLSPYALTAQVAHERNKGGGSYLLVPLWWVGTVLMIFGELGNLVAYSLAKPSLISPLGAISVLVNVPAAYITLGERPSASNMVGCVLYVPFTPRSPLSTKSCIDIRCMV